MKPNTTKAIIATVLATAFAGLSITAIAQNTSAPAAVPAELHAQHMAQRVKASGATDPARVAEMQKRMTERHAQRMERLKAELKITPAQDAAWAAFVARTEPQPPQARAAGDNPAQLTTPQRLDLMAQRHNQRGAEMAQRADATKALYAQLTPEQQKTFDTQRGGFQRAGMQGEHRHGSKGGHGAHGGKGQHGMGGGQGCEGGSVNGPMNGPGPRS